MLRSRTIRLVVFSAAGVVASAGLVVGALHTSAAKRFALGQVVRLLAGQGIGLQASRLDYNLLRQTIDLRDVRVRSLDASDLPPLVAVNHLSAEFDLRRILAGAYHLNDASVDNLHIHLVIAADGRDNVPKLPPKTTTSKPIDYLLRRLLVSGGEFRFDDRRRQIAGAAVLESIAISGDPLSRKHQVSVRTKDGSRITRAGRDLAVTGLAADLSFADPRLDLRVQAGLNLASLREFASMPAPLSGKVGLEITAAGTLTRPQGHGPRSRRQSGGQTVRQHEAGCDRSLRLVYGQSPAGFGGHEFTVGEVRVAGRGRSGPRFARGPWRIRHSGCRSRSRVISVRFNAQARGHRFRRRRSTVAGPAVRRGLRRSIVANACLRAKPNQGQPAG